MLHNLALFPPIVHYRQIVPKIMIICKVTIASIVDKHIVVLILGLGITFPACFNQYWSVDEKQLTITSYSNNDFKKLAQLFNLTSKDQTIINLSNVQEAAIVYRKIVRLSPFNFNPDHLLLGITTKDGKEFDLDLGNIDYQGLATITLYLSEAGAKVDDQQGILRLLSENQNLFKHFHKKWASL